MKLSDIKKKADAKAAEVEAARKQAQLMKELDVHPLIKWGCARDVRDAYFCGIVFAALADDVKIDEGERKAIDRIGHSLALSVEEVEDVAASVSKVVKDAIEAGGDSVFALLEESAAALKEEKVFRLFVAEYVKVCSTKEFDAKDVLESQLIHHVAPSAGQNLTQSAFNSIRRAVVEGVNATSSELFALSEFLGEDACRYFMLDARGDVVDEIRMELKRRQVAKAAAKRKRDAEAAIAKVRAAFDDWLNAIADQYDLKKIPSGVPRALSRRANEFDMSKLDFGEIKRKIVAGCKSSQRRMAWKLLGYFALRFELTDTCPQTRSVEYLMKTVFSHDSSIWGSGYSGKNVVQAFKDCFEKYDV